MVLEDKEKLNESYKYRVGTMAGGMAGIVGLFFGLPIAGIFFLGGSMLGAKLGA